VRHRLRDGLRFATRIFELTDDHERRNGDLARLRAVLPVIRQPAFQERSDDRAVTVMDAPNPVRSGNAFGLTHLTDDRPWIAALP